jgi:hypothetical protein
VPLQATRASGPCALIPAKARRQLSALSPKFGGNSIPLVLDLRRAAPSPLSNGSCCRAASGSSSRSLGIACGMTSRSVSSLPGNTFCICERKSRCGMDMIPGRVSSLINAFMGGKSTTSEPYAERSPHDQQKRRAPARHFKMISTAFSAPLPGPAAAAPPWAGRERPTAAAARHSVRAPAGRKRSWFPAAGHRASPPRGCRP